MASIVAWTDRQIHWTTSQYARQLTARQQYKSACDDVEFESAHGMRMVCREAKIVVAIKRMLDLSASTTKNVRTRSVMEG